MSDNWGRYKNGQIPTSALYPVQGYYLRPDAAHALIAAITDLAKKKIKISINEGYRPLGIPADQHIRDEKKTSTRSSNQWFQYGRAQRGETPTAAYPGGSIHGWGLAADLNPGANNSTVVSVMKAHGFIFDIGSESWHCRFVGVPKPTPEPSIVQKRSWKGLQGYLKKNWGYAGLIDGKPGTGTWVACQKWLAAHWLYKGAIDGVPGLQTYAALNRAGVKLK
jgi:hypothetical protein